MIKIIICWIVGHITPIKFVGYDGLNYHCCCSRCGNKLIKEHCGKWTEVDKFTGWQKY